VPLEREVVHWTKNEFSFAVHMSHSAAIKEKGHIPSFWHIVKKRGGEAFEKNKCYGLYGFHGYTRDYIY